MFRQCRGRLCEVVVLLLATASCTLCGKFYAHVPEQTAITFSCKEKWCNETW